MQLNRATIAQITARGTVAVGPLDLFPEKVIQFGSGNFLRGFADWMFNELNKRNLFNGRVIIVKMLSSHSPGKLNQQDGLYTLLLRGVQNGKVVEQAQIITAISRELNPYIEWKQFLACAELPELRYVVSNATEAGIEYVQTGQPASECPASFPAKLTAFLFHRYKHFAGAPGRGMVILPCELIERNGTMLKELILRHAADWKLEEGFAEWLKTACRFFNTLVDRIVPGYPTEEAASLAQSLGYEDTLLDTGEPFHLWVLEGDMSVSRELSFADAGLNVLWTDNLTPYRTRKVRILNGAHTMSVLAAFQAGKDTVLEMVNDKTIGTFMRRGIFDEIIPTLDLPEKEKSDFAASVIERFQNPFIKHHLLSISLNSVSKFKVRVLPSLLKYAELKQRIPEVLAFSLAALITFYRGKLDKHGVYMGDRNGTPYEIKDNQEYLRFFNQQWQTNVSDVAVLTRNILANQDMWGRDLSVISGLTDTTTLNVQLIVDKGIIAAMTGVSGV